jgi:hypothetical protein
VARDYCDRVTIFLDVAVDITAATDHIACSEATESSQLLAHIKAPNDRDDLELCESSGGSI